MTDVTVIERLEAIEAIKHLKSRYFRYVDQKDWAAWRAIFKDDGHFEIGVGEFDDADSFVGNVREFLEGSVTFHHGHMPEIDIVGPGEATGVWTLYDVVEPRAELGVAAFYGYARYWERYERDGGVWKIASMRIERLRKVDFQG
jgi:3-phenylpropionate/cinnamic acid dioxygenase small subunit